MALLGNYAVLLKSAGTYRGGSTLAAERANYNKLETWFNVYCGGGVYSSNKFNSFDGKPLGYRPPAAWHMARIDGGMASETQISGSGSVSSANLAGGKYGIATLTGSGTITNAGLGLTIQLIASIAGTCNISAAIKGIGTRSAGLTGTGTISSASDTAKANLSSTVTGSGSVSASDLRAKGNIAAEISPFTELSPENLATQLLDSNEIETGYSLREALRLILSSAAGKLSGAETTTVTIRNVVDDKSRIIATVDANGNRTSISYDVSDS